MLDFWIPLALLFAAATIAAIATRRKRDRCLKHFDHQPVLVLRQTGQWLWGRFLAYPKSMELVFENPRPGPDGLAKASYVLYAPEIEGIRKILMPPPLPGAPGREDWERELGRIANPSPARRFRRWLWNIFNTLRDAVSQSISMVLGTLKTKTVIGKVAGADKRAGEIGNTLLETVPNAYEPVLEKYLGKHVVVELLDAGGVTEYTGLLQEYSGKYLLLRNVAFNLGIDTGPPLRDRYDAIFPRSMALVRHRLERYPDEKTGTGKDFPAPLKMG